MGTIITILCAVMVVLAIFLVVAVLMQSGKETGLSGTIAGGAETFFGKTKGKTIDRVLSKATTIVSIIFVFLVLAVYILQAAESNNQVNADASSSSQPAATETVEAETGEEEPETVYATEEEAAQQTTEEN